MMRFTQCVTSSCRRQPAQTTGFDEVSLKSRPDQAVDAASADLVSPGPSMGIVDADHHGGVGAEESADRQAAGAAASSSMARDDHTARLSTPW